MNNFVPDKRYTMKRILFVYLFLGGLLLHEAGNACTSVIVSGKATPDGRPLMWKHRDTGTRYNHITFEKGRKNIISSDWQTVIRRIMISGQALMKPDLRS